MEQLYFKIQFDSSFSKNRVITRFASYPVFREDDNFYYFFQEYSTVPNKVCKKSHNVFAGIMQPLDVPEILMEDVIFYPTKELWENAKPKNNIKFKRTRRFNHE